MAKTLTIHTRIEPEIKEKADAILAELGISTTEAINMFLRQVIRYCGIPQLCIPNAETMAAMEETEELLAYGITRFSSRDEMFEELKNNVKLWIHQCFQKDFKRVSEQGKDTDLLMAVMNNLIDENPLPLRYKDHALLGKYEGYRECHVQPNFLLVYKGLLTRSCA